MIEVTANRVGTLTEVVAICPSNDLVPRVAEIFASATTRFSRSSGIDSLVVRVTCKRSEAERIVGAVERLSYRTAPAAGPAASLPAGADTSGRRRELIQATELAERQARSNPPAEAGRRLMFTGFGEEFIGREIHGHLWGERVRYAYYVDAAA